MTVLFLISLFVIAIYIAVVIVKSGIPYSISDTYYRIDRKKWFMFVMLVTGFSLLPVALEVSSESSQFLIFLTVVGLAMVGVSPNFKGEKSERNTHYAGAIMLLVFSQLWVLFNFKWILLLWVIYVVYIACGLIKKKSGPSFYDDLVNLKPVFWAEITLIITTYVAVLIGLWRSI